MGVFLSASVFSWASHVSVGPSGLDPFPKIPGAARFALAPGYLMPRLRRFPLSDVLTHLLSSLTYAAPSALPLGDVLTHLLSWLTFAAPSARPLNDVLTHLLSWLTFAAFGASHRMMF
jgi:hypothetical protein